MTPASLVGTALLHAEARAIGAKLPEAAAAFVQAREALVEALLATQKYRDAYGSSGTEQQRTAAANFDAAMRKLSGAA